MCLNPLRELSHSPTITYSFSVLQYKIPQDVQLEDKIVGPLTMKQLIIVATGGGISYSIFLFVSKSYLLGLIDYFFIAIPLLLSLAFSFVRINDVSFLKWLLLLYEFGHNARRRKWDKSETARLHFAFVTAKMGESAAQKKETDEKNQKQKNIQVLGKKKFSSLEELTQVLDHQNPFLESPQSIPAEHTDDTISQLAVSEKQHHGEELFESARGEKKEFFQPSLQKVSSTSSSKEISFEKLQQGGSISFS